MLGLSEKNNDGRNFAYTLAEMLIVMMIIMLVILSLPMATKKVFKLEETRKSHGRYECYWGIDPESGKKTLMTYMAEENGRQITSKSIKADEGVCIFEPPLNPIYFMIHAVGGGGAGAQLTPEKSNLEPVEQVSAVSNLYNSNPALFPNWVDYIVKKGSVPWGSKTAFDVNKVSFQQLVRYRLGGTAAKVVSMFVPQIPPTVTMEIKVGKGGELTTTGSGSGGNGGDTVITFVYKPVDGGTEKRYEALLARGGIGGDGSIDGKTSVMMIGGEPGDFGLSSLASISGKDSGFDQITESAEKFDALKTRVTYNAGAGGSGVVQFVSKTDGYIFYEYDDNQIASNSRRLNSNWKNITDDVGLHFYRSANLSHNCVKATEPSVEVKRSGYCTPSEGVSKFACTIGTNSNTDDNKGCSDPSNCSKFNVEYDWGTNKATISPNPTTYSPADKFYNCKFRATDFTIACMTRLTNVKVHKCTTPTTGEVKCSNGKPPVGTGKSAKCAAEAGGDGAVVILW